tara:strand:+ start:3615 stop:4118 length:504 start_codon:yes stop_codon:yes gene_type:complete
MALAKGPSQLHNITGYLSVHPNISIPATQELVVVDGNGTTSVVLGPVTFLPGHAVCLVQDILNNTQTYNLCSSHQDKVETFLGFQINDISNGARPLVATGRGSIITPIVQDGVPLIPNSSVFLSPVSGQVTQNSTTLLASESGSALLIGFAISTTQMILAPEEFTRN